MKGYNGGAVKDEFRALAKLFNGDHIQEITLSPLYLLEEFIALIAINGE
jgi:hypothetical protein